MRNIFDQDHTIPVQNPTYPMANLKSSAYAAPLGFNRPTEALGGYDTQVNPMTGQEMPQTNFARGGKVDDFTSALHDGMAAYAQGGPVQHFKFGDKVGGEGSTSGQGISISGTPFTANDTANMLGLGGGSGQLYTYDPNSFGGFGGGYSGGSKGLDDALGYITETAGGLTEYGRGLADWLASNVNISGGEQTNAATLQNALASEGTHISLDQASNIINQASGKANASLDSGVNLAAAYNKTGGADTGGAGGNGLASLGEVTVLGARPSIFETMPKNILGGIDPKTGQFVVPEPPTGLNLPGLEVTTEDPSVLQKAGKGAVNVARTIGRGAINAAVTGGAAAVNPWLGVASKLGGVGETVANKIIPKTGDLTTLPEVVVKTTQPDIYVPPLINVGSYFDRFKAPVEDIPAAGTGTELDPVTISTKKPDDPKKPGVIPVSITPHIGDPNTGVDTGLTPAQVINNIITSQGKGGTDIYTSSNQIVDSGVTPEGGGSGGGGGTTTPYSNAFLSAFDPMYSASTSAKYGGSNAQNLEDYMANLNQSLRPGPITPYTFQTAPSTSATPQGIAALKYGNQETPTTQTTTTQPKTTTTTTQPQSTTNTGATTSASNLGLSGIVKPTTPGLTHMSDQDLTNFYKFHGIDIDAINAANAANNAAINTPEKISELTNWWDATFGGKAGAGTTAPITYQAGASELPEAQRQSIYKTMTGGDNKMDQADIERLIVDTLSNKSNYTSAPVTLDLLKQYNPDAYSKVVSGVSQYDKNLSSAARLNRDVMYDELGFKGTEGIGGGWQSTMYDKPGETLAEHVAAQIKANETYNQQHPDYAHGTDFGVFDKATIAAMTPEQLARYGLNAYADKYSPTTSASPQATVKPQGVASGSLVPTQAPTYLKEPRRGIIADPGYTPTESVGLRPPTPTQAPPDDSGARLAITDRAGFNTPEELDKYLADRRAQMEADNAAQAERTRLYNEQVLANMTPEERADFDQKQAATRRDFGNDNPGGSGGGRNYQYQIPRMGDGSYPDLPSMGDGSYLPAVDSQSRPTKYYQPDENGDWLPPPRPEYDQFPPIQTLPMPDEERKYQYQPPSIGRGYESGPYEPITDEAYYGGRKQFGNEPNIDEAFAHGGVTHGGFGSLPGTYKAGGTLLRGPGDGMSDSIPAVIQGRKVQRAALADGEFVIPADVVSHLGNGSTDAGARKLYAMMNKIRQARTGRTRQAPEVSADRYMPKA